MDCPASPIKGWSDSNPKPPWVHIGRRLSVWRAGYYGEGGHWAQFCDTQTPNKDGLSLQLQLTATDRQIWFWLGPRLKRKRRERSCIPRKSPTNWDWVVSLHLGVWVGHGQRSPDRSQTAKARLRPVTRDCSATLQNSCLSDFEHKCWKKAIGPPSTYPPTPNSEPWTLGSPWQSDMHGAMFVVHLWFHTNHNQQHI